MVNSTLYLVFDDLSNKKKKRLKTICKETLGVKESTFYNYLSRRKPESIPYAMVLIFSRELQKPMSELMQVNYKTPEDINDGILKKTLPRSRKG